MSNINTPAIHYRLVPDDAGLKLDIWEPADQNEHRKASFHFYVSYQLSTAEEAQHILDQYLLDNDVCSAVCLDGDCEFAPATMVSSRTQTHAS
ncbi:MAG: hypothetical protein AAFR42_02660 [Cyanobacteria bacterium J06628_6]